MVTVNRSQDIATFKRVLGENRWCSLRPWRSPANAIEGKSLDFNSRQAKVCIGCGLQFIEGKPRRVEPGLIECSCRDGSGVTKHYKKVFRRRFYVSHWTASSRLIA